MISKTISDEKLKIKNAFNVGLIKSDFKHDTKAIAKNNADKSLLEQKHKSEGFFNKLLSKLTCCYKPTKTIEDLSNADETISLQRRDLYKKFEPVECWRNYKIEDWANKNFKRWETSLSVDEKNSIALYTGEEYILINKILRGKGSGHEYEPRTVKLIEDITVALSKAKIPENIVVYRGCDKNVLGDFVNNPKLLIGKTLSDKAFMSTALIKNSAFKSDILMKIRVPEGANGAYIGHFSWIDDEYEVLFQRGQKLLVTDVKFEMVPVKAFGEWKVKKKIKIYCDLLH